MQLGIALALVCAVVTQLGFLCKHRGAGCAPLVALRRPLASARALLASKWFAIGMAIAVGAWVLHVFALALAPLSTVQVVLSTGVVILAVLGDRVFGHTRRPPPVGRRRDDRRSGSCCSSSRCRRPTATTRRSPSPA